MILWQTVVFAGLWASCTPSARKLFIVILALSRPGDGELGEHLTPEELREVAAEACMPNGSRHVIPNQASPSKLGSLAGLPDRTRREGMERLFQLNLIQDSKDSTADLQRAVELAKERKVAGFQDAF